MVIIPSNESAMTVNVQPACVYAKSHCKHLKTIADSGEIVKLHEIFK